MGRAVLRYRISCEGAVFPRGLATQLPNLSITVRQPTGADLDVEVKVDGVDSKEAAEQIAAPALAALGLALVLSVEVAIRIGPAEKTDADFFAGPVTGGMIRAPALVANAVIASHVDPQACGQVEQRALLAAAPGWSAPRTCLAWAVDLLRASFAQSDPLVAYILSYNCIAVLCEDDHGREPGVAEVDRYIKTQDPAILTAPNPQRPTQLESVFTRLRNEIAHSHAQVRQRPVAELVTEVRQRLPALRLLVAKLLSPKLAL